MRDLRLLPAALAVWAATLAVVWGRGWQWGALTCAVAAVLLFRARGQAVLAAALGALATAVTQRRIALADAIRWPDRILARAAGPPTKTGSGWVLRTRVEGSPGTLPVFSRDDGLAGVRAGDQVVVSGGAVDADAPSVVGKLYVANHVDAHRVAAGWAGWVGELKAEFTAKAAGLLGQPGAGLLPAMVMGDTSGQSAQDKEAYLATGLAHLSAVSGGNVAIVTTSAVVALAAMGAGPRVRLAGAGLALVGFVAVVGFEPSILRAAATGAISLVAMASSTKAPPIHALCLAVIGLVLYDSDLAASFGFALSVAATAGIIALTPFFQRGLARLAWPEVLTKALAVAIAAEVSTMPLVALVAGKVSVVGVAANVLVAPVVAPITVIGLVGLVLTALPGGLEQIAIGLSSPLVGFVGLVARWGARLPQASVPVPHDAVGVGFVVLLSCWVVALLVDARPRLAAAIAGLALVFAVG